MLFPISGWTCFLYMILLYPCYFWNLFLLVFNAFFGGTPDTRIRLIDLRSVSFSFPSLVASQHKSTKRKKPSRQPQPDHVENPKATFQSERASWHSAHKPSNCIRILQLKTCVNPHLNRKDHQLLVVLRTKLMRNVFCKFDKKKHQHVLRVISVLSIS
jgi:hypothetical protein